MAEEEMAAFSESMAQSALKMAQEAKRAQEKLKEARAGLGEIPSLDDLSPEKPADRKKAKIPSMAPEALAGVNEEAAGIQDKAIETKEMIGDLKVEVPADVEDHLVLQDAPTDEAYTPKGIRAEEMATTAKDKASEAKNSVAGAVDELEVPPAPTDEGALSALTDKLEVPQAPTDEGALSALVDKRDEIGATLENGAAEAKDAVSAGVDAVDEVVKSPVERAEHVATDAKEAVAAGVGAIGESVTSAGEATAGTAEEMAPPDVTHSPTDEVPAMIKDTAVEEVIPKTDVEGETQATGGGTEEKVAGAGFAEETGVNEATTVEEPPSEEPSKEEPSTVPEPEEAKPVPSAETEANTVEESEQEERKPILPESSTEESSAESKADIVSPPSEDQPIVQEEKPEESFLDSLTAAATGAVAAGTAAMAAGTAAVMDMVEEVAGPTTVEEPAKKEEEPMPSSEKEIFKTEPIAEPPAIGTQPTDEERASDEQKPNESVVGSIAASATSAVAGGVTAVKDAAEDITEEVKSSVPSDEKQTPSGIESKEAELAPTSTYSKEIAEIEGIWKRDTDAPDDEVAQDAVKTVTEEEVEEETETTSPKATSDVPKTRDFASEAAAQQEASTLCGCIIL